MEKTKTLPSDFIKSLPDDRRDAIATLDKLISKAIPDAEKTMWEGIFWGGSEQKIIGYGDYSYKGRSGRTGNWFIVGLALQKNYITVFISAIENGAYITEKYKNALGKVKVGKSTISFNSLEDVKLDTLIEVLKRGYTLMKETKLLAA